jgi:hypothetical protein
MGQERSMSEPLGPTGEFPNGAITSGDHGEIKIAVGVHEPSRTIVLRFGTTLKWVGFDVAQAREIARRLTTLADQLDPPAA